MDIYYTLKGGVMGRKIWVEVNLGQKAVERCDIFVYLEGKLVESYFDKSYNDIAHIANKLRTAYGDVQIETWCSGEDCCGRIYRWQIDI